MYDVAIIGAGVIGALIAREMTRYQLSVCILEKEGDVAMGASKANSAIVHAGHDAKPGTLKAMLNVRGSEMFEDLCAELGVPYKRNGALIVGTEEEVPVIEELLERGRINRVKGLRIVRDPELHQMEPLLRDEITVALYAPTSAITCPYELTVAAVGNAMDNGAHLRRNFKVTSIQRTTDGYDIYSGSDKISARYYVNCAGLYAGEINAMNGGEDFQRTPRAGEYIILDKDCGSLVNHTVFPIPTKHGKGILVTQSVDGNLLLGPTSIEREGRDNTVTTAEGLNSIIDKTSRTFKNLPYNKVIHSFTGLRSVDDDFLITSGDNCINLMRFGSPGLSAAPAIALYVREMLAGMGLRMVQRYDFNPKREGYHAVREMDMKARNELIKKNSKYGRIICRCEGVSEGEIIDAIRRNPGATDLDGIKRRTRSGMGRCQGGFCSSYVLEILARELGVAPEEVTKFGKSSYVLVGHTKEVK